MTAKKFTLQAVCNEIYRDALKYRGKYFSLKLPRGLFVGAKIEKNGQSVFFCSRDDKYPGQTEFETTLTRWAKRGDYAHLKNEFFEFPVIMKINGRRHYFYIRYNGGKRIDSDDPDTRQTSYWDGKE